MADRSRPHKFPRAALKAEGDILGWECEACGEWVREFGPTEPDECPIDWRNANVRPASFLPSEANSLPCATARTDTATSGHG